MSEARLKHNVNQKIEPFLRIFRQVTTSEWGIKESIGKISTVTEVTALDLVYHQIEQEIFSILEIKDVNIQKEIKDILYEMRTDWNAFEKLIILFEKKEV